MKLKATHEHFTTKDNGRSWSPKASYDSLDEVKEKEPLYPHKRRAYICGQCKKYHTCRIRINNVS